MSQRARPLALGFSLSILLSACVAQTPAPQLDATASTKQFSFTREALHRGLQINGSTHAQPSIQQHSYRLTCVDGAGANSAASRFKVASAAINRTQPLVYESIIGDSHLTRNMIRDANMQIVTPIGCQVVGLERKVLTRDALQMLQWARKHNVLPSALGAN